MTTEDDLILEDEVEDKTNNSEFYRNIADGFVKFLRSKKYCSIINKGGNKDGRKK